MKILGRILVVTVLFLTSVIWIGPYVIVDIALSNTLPNPFSLVDYLFGPLP